MWSPDLADQIFPWWQGGSPGSFTTASSPFGIRTIGWDSLFLGQAQPGAAYPLNWLLWLLPQKHGLIGDDGHQLVFRRRALPGSTLLLSGLCAGDPKRSRAASLIAGLAFALAGYIVAGNRLAPDAERRHVDAPGLPVPAKRVWRVGVHPWSSASLSGAACIGMAWLERASSSADLSHGGYGGSLAFYYIFSKTAVPIGE